MALTLEVDGNDQTAALRHNTLHVKLKSIDFTLFDPSPEPVILDVVEVACAAGTFTGKVKGISTDTFDGPAGYGRYIEVACTRGGTLPDLGAGMALTDASPPANFARLRVKSRRSNGVTEVRGEVTVYEDGLLPGNETDITSAAEGYTAETFTVMDMDLSYPTSDDAAPRYRLDLGLGDYATATTGAGDGGPLDPPTLDDYIEDVAGEACCGGCEDVQDFFNRTETGIWGTASTGQVWAEVAGATGADFGVDGSAGWIDLGSGGDGFYGEQGLDFTERTLVTAYADLVCSVEHAGAEGIIASGVYSVILGSNGTTLELWGDTSDSDTVSVDITTAHRIEIGLDGGNIVARAYNIPDTAPAWQVSIPATLVTISSLSVWLSNSGSASDCILSADAIAVSCDEAVTGGGLTDGEVAAHAMVW